MMKTKDNFTIIKEMWNGGFIICHDVGIEYDPESGRWIDDRIRRIDTGIYGGDLITSQHMLVMKSNSGAEDDMFKGLDDKSRIEEIIKLYMCSEPIMLSFCQHHRTVVSAESIKSIFFNAEKSWANQTGVMVDEKIIYQGPNLPIKIEGVSSIEVYNADFGMFGIDNFTNWIPFDTPIEGFDEIDIYHIHGVFKVDSIYRDKIHLKEFTLVDGKESIPHKFYLPADGFIDDKTFNIIGFYNDVELDVFFKAFPSTDEISIVPILVTANLDKWMKTQRPEKPYIPGGKDNEDQV